ncbi:MAG TPA: hypothetical protein VLW44_03795 [Streptosporangiaceae bacterium]|nr:hypothetical protein [Streptosporangiaceae bacterium]
MITIHNVLLAAIAAAAYCLFVFASPVGMCLRCLGRRRHRSLWNGRMRACRSCRGNGARRRIGATAVHRFYWIAFGNRQRELRREALREELRDRSQS